MQQQQLLRAEAAQGMQQKIHTRNIEQLKLKLKEEKSAKVDPKKIQRLKNLRRETNANHIMKAIFNLKEE